MSKVTIKKEVEQVVNYGDTLLLNDGGTRLLAKVSGETIGIRDNGTVGTRKGDLQEAVDFYNDYFGIKQVIKSGAVMQTSDEATFSGVQEIEVEIEEGDMLKLGDGTHRLIIQAGTEYITWNPYGHGFMRDSISTGEVVNFYNSSSEFGGIVGVVKQPLQGKDS